MQTLSKCPDGLLQGHDISLFQLEKFRFRRDTSNHAIVMKVRKWNVTILIFSIQRSTVRVILLCVTNFLKILKTSRSWETPCQSISPGENWWVVWSVMHFDRIMQDLVRLVVYANLEDHKYRPNTCQVCCLHKQAGELGWKSELPNVLHLFIAQVWWLLM